MRGQVRNAAAKSRPGLEPAVVLVDRIDECDARYKAALKKRGRRPGTPPKPCVDIVFAGPRIDIGPWSFNQALAWARDCRAFTERRVGECVALAVLHTDEGAWHSHALVSCCLPQMPLGSDAVRKVMAAGYADKVRLIGPHRRELRAIVDAYQAEVGRRWGFVDPDRAVNARPKRIDVALARRLRIQDQLIIAEINLARAGEVQDFNAIDYPDDPYNAVIAEITVAWAKRVAELENALDNDDFSVVNYSDPVPGYSAAEWAQRREDLRKDAEIDAEAAGDHAEPAAIEDPGDPVPGKRAKAHAERANYWRYARSTPK